MRSTHSWPARYSTECLACNERIQVDELVRWDEDQVIHGDCNSIHRPTRPEPETCPRCFMVYSVSGVCGCES